MNLRVCTWLVVLCAVSTLTGYAQYWETDPYFTPVLESAGPGYSTPTLLAAPGGKVLVSGVYAVNSVHAPEVRLNSDGSVDPTFDVAKEGSSGVLATYADGRVLMTKRSGALAVIYRRKADRTEDPSFTPVSVEGYPPNASLLPDGRILVWGSLYAVGGVATNNLAMLEPDGTVSTTFHSPFVTPVAEGDLGALFVAPTADGKFIAVGPLGGLGAPSFPRIVRLMADGSVDPGFNASSAAFPSLAQRAYPQPNGQVLVTYGPGIMAGPDVTGILRLNADGTLDSTFAPELAGEWQSFGDQQKDGKIIYLSFDAQYTHLEVRRIHADGTADPTFVVRAPTGTGFAVWPAVAADDGTYFFASPVTPERHALGLRITRVLANGTVDPNFSPVVRAEASIDTFTRQPDGKLLVAGLIAFAGGKRIGEHTSLIRLNSDGSLDEDFVAPLAATEAAVRLRTQPDGKIVASGQFLDGAQARSYVRFKADGTRDSSFTAPAASSARFEVDGLGRIYALTNASGNNDRQLERYTAAGVLDTSFKRATLGLPNLFGVWPDGRVVIATEIPSTPGRFSLTRLDAEGNVDAGFVIDPASLPETLLALVTIPHGGVVAVGYDVRGQSKLMSYARFGPGGATEYRYHGHNSVSPEVSVDHEEVGGVLLDALRSAALPTTSGARFDLDGVALIEVEAPSRMTSWAKQVVSGSLGLAVRRCTSLTGPSVDPRPVAALPSSTGPNATAMGGAATASVVGCGLLPLSYQWQKDGVTIPGANSSELTLTHFRPIDVGAYTVVLTNEAGSSVSPPMFLGATSTAKVTGDAAEVGSDIRHPSGRVLDQILLKGEAATITADPGQTTRLSYIDLSDDIVQVEFSGAGALTVRLDDASGPAAPVRYVQPGVAYMKGHATIVIVGADETTNLSVFSVGRANAVDQSLFRDDVVYDGVADLALIRIEGSGFFGGLRCANTSFFAKRGLTGIYAPTIGCRGPVYAGDINAYDDAEPTLRIGGTSSAILITGGNLSQSNGRPVQVSGFKQLKFVAGATSHGIPLPAQANKARIEQNGIDVTAQIVVNPTP